MLQFLFISYEIFVPQHPAQVFSYGWTGIKISMISDFAGYIDWLRKAVLNQGEIFFIGKFDAFLPIENIIFFPLYPWLFFQWDMLISSEVVVSSFEPIRSITA